MIKNVYWSSRKVPVILARFSWSFNFLGGFSTNHRISNFVKIRPVGAELLHADRRTDGRTNGRTGRQTNTTKEETAFRKNLRKAPKIAAFTAQCNPAQQMCQCNLAASSNNLPSTDPPTRRKLVSNWEADSFFLLRKLLRHRKLHSILLCPRKHHMSYREVLPGEGEDLTVTALNPYPANVENMVSF